MIPIVVWWSEHVAVSQGHVYKLVPCENCATEYVYLLEREGIGASTVAYPIGGEGGEDQAVLNAEIILNDYLKNDFDPVPCPVCGHYQKYMFSKLQSTNSLSFLLVTVAIFVIGSFAALLSVYWIINTIERPSQFDPWRLGSALTVVLIAIIARIKTTSAQRAKELRFNPNDEDQKARIARGRTLAMTRAEFEARPPQQAGSNQNSE